MERGDDPGESLHVTKSVPGSPAVLDVEVQRLRDHCGSVGAEHIGGGSNGAAAVAIVRGDHQVRQARQRPRVIEGPVEEPFHPGRGHTAIAQDRGYLSQVSGLAPIAPVMVTHEALRESLDQINVQQLDEVRRRFDPGHEPAHRLGESFVVLDVGEKAIVGPRQREVETEVATELGAAGLAAPAAIAAPVGAGIVDRRAQRVDVFHCGERVGEADQFQRSVAGLVWIPFPDPCFGPGLEVPEIGA